MKISWTNLHYFVIGALVFNFVLLYVLSVTQVAKETIVNNDNPSPIQLRKANDTQIQFTNSFSINHNQNLSSISNSSDNSIAENIGKSITSGSKPYPIPVTGAVKKLVEVTKEEAEAFSLNDDNNAKGYNSMMYLIILIVTCVISLFIYEILIKKKEGNGMLIDYNPNDKYVLLDCENETEENQTHIK